MNPNAVIDTSPGRIKSLTYFGIFINFLLMISKFAEGHKIAEKVEKIVRQSLNRPANIITHVEPDIPFERRKLESDK